VARFVVASPRDGRRPDAVLAKRAVVRRGCGGAGDVSAGSSVLRRLGLGQPPRGHLQSELGRGQKPQTTRERVEGTEVEARPLFIGFTPIEDRRFGLPPAGIDASRNDAKRNVGRVEPMMSDRRQRVRHGGYAVGICHGSQGRLASGTAINLPADRSLQRGVVLRRDLH
jgi:hypothetical protein